jgi:hypothetical protein
MQATGFSVDHYTYTPVFVAAGLLPFLTTLILFALVIKRSFVQPRFEKCYKKPIPVVLR